MLSVHTIYTYVVCAQDIIIQLRILSVCGVCTGYNYTIAYLECVWCVHRI